MEHRFILPLLILISSTTPQLGNDPLSGQSQELLLAALSKALLTIPPTALPEPQPPMVQKSSSTSAGPLPKKASPPLRAFTTEGLPVSATPLFQAPASAQSSADEPNKIILGQIYTLDNNLMTFTLEDDLEKGFIHILKVSGLGSLSVELFASAESPTADYSLALLIENFLRPSLIPITADFILAKGAAIKISSGPSQVSAMALKISISRERAISIGFNENFKIHTKFAKGLHCQVSNPTLNADSTLQNRLQFILQTSLESQQIYGGEEAAMFINRSPGFPSDSEFELKASGSLGSGLIKTISPGSRHYCFEENCVYYVTIYTAGVEFVNFFPTVFANGSILQFRQFLFLVEEIEPGEKIEYQLEVPKIEGRWVFSVIPTMGSVELFINPDFRPSHFGLSKYMVHSARAEEIVITAEEARDFGFSHERFFIAYKSFADEKPAAFRFEVRRFNPGEPKFIRENFAEGGFASKNEVVNFYLSLGSEIPQSLNAVFKLDSFSGHADLYIKECLPSEKECEVTAGDIGNGEKKVATEERIFRTGNFEVGDKDRPGKSDFITLNFNCQRTNSPQTFKNNFPISNSCLFAVGVHCRTTLGQAGARYKLVAFGQGAMSNLRLHSSTTTKLARNERANFRIDVSQARQSPEITALSVKVIAISGKARVYFSKTSETPDEADHDASIEVQDESLVSLRTVAYEAQVNLASDFSFGQNPGQRFVYMSIKGEEYCVLEVFPEFSGPQFFSGTEAIKEANIIHRKITGADFYIDPKSQSTVYFSNFLFKVPQKSQYRYFIVPKLDISLNAPLSGMRICVQENRADFDPDSPCQFQSSTAHLLLDEKQTPLNKGKNFIISIQKPIPQGQKFQKFPIDFTLGLNAGASAAELELHLPGKPFSSVLAPSEGLQLKFDLSAMRRGGQIYFYTTDPGCQATLSVGEGLNYHYLASLDHGLIGVNIRDAGDFKARYCRSGCVVKVGIYSFGAQASRFTLLYQIDGRPVVLGEGDQVTVANNIEAYFVYEADDSSSVSFSAHSDHSQSVIYAKVLPERNLNGTKDLKAELSASNFDFKTNIESAPVLVFPRELLKKMRVGLLGFLVEPKLHFRRPRPETLDLIGAGDALTVRLHAKALKLRPLALTDGCVAGGEFLYYEIAIDHPGEFSVILSLHGGEAALYIGRGGDDFPTEKRFWKKSSGCKGDEISVTRDDFENEGQMVGTYVVGVRGIEQAHFSLLLLPEFKNLVKMRFQRLVDMTLAKDKNYYFDFSITQKSYNTLLFAENSDVEISALKYDDNKYQDFLSMVTNEDNYLQKFTIKKGDLPREKFFDDAIEAGTHVIVRARAIFSDAGLNLLIFDSQRPIFVPTEKRFSFVQRKDEKMVFVAKLDAKYEEVDLDVKLDFGNIGLSYSDLPDSFSNSRQISTPSQKYFQFRVEKKEQSNDIRIFNEFYIQIESREFSKFSFLIKPKNKFKQLKASEPEIIFTSPENDVFAFFHISAQQAKILQNVVIDLNSVHYFDQRPELLFIAESDVLLDETSPFLPMPLRDLSARDSKEFRHLEIIPEIQPGFFILKIAKFPKRLPVKINVSLDNQKNIETNGLYQAAIPRNQAASLQYSMFIPREGEFRLVIESCAGAKIAEAEFSSPHPVMAAAASEDHNIYQYRPALQSTAIKFEDDFAQGHSFLFLNETRASGEIQVRTLAFPVRRGFVAEKGVLRFRVVRDEAGGSRPPEISQEEFYTLLSEFRPADKELIFKDYVKFFDPSEKVQKRLFGYKFGEGADSLEISSLLPVFHAQLLVDYPLLKVVRMKIFSYLLAEPDVIAKLEKCGQSMLKTVVHDLKIVEREFTRERLERFDAPLEFISVIFSAEEIAKYAKFPHLNLLSFISAEFYESEDEEFNVNLDFKYTNVPYFLLTIPNRKAHLLSVSTGLKLIAIILLIFFAIFYLRAGTEREEGTKKEYKKARDDSFSQESTRLEMSTMANGDNQNA